MKNRIIAVVLVSVITLSAFTVRGFAFFYPFMVTRVENCPAVLVECGFISNSQDFAIINTPAGQNSIARGIYNGIVEYCSWY